MGTLEKVSAVLDMLDRQHQEMKDYICRIFDTTISKAKGYPDIDDTNNPIWDKPLSVVLPDRPRVKTKVVTRLGNYLVRMGLKDDFEPVKMKHLKMAIEKDLFSRIHGMGYRSIDYAEESYRIVLKEEGLL